MKMDITPISIAISIFAVTIVTWALRVLNWVWLRPKKLEKCLREQGLHGNPYKLLLGDMKEFITITKEAKTKPLKLSDDVAPHVLPYHHHIINKYGKNSFVWVGPTPRLNIVDPEMIRDVLLKHNVFHKQESNPLTRLLLEGLVTLEGDSWATRRKIVSPAFSLQKVKHMFTAIYSSCNEIMSKWETLVSTKGSCEVDVWPYLQNLSGEVISRTAFSSSYEEGRKIFQIQNEQAKILFQLWNSSYIPGWRFLPTKRNRRLKELHNEAHDVVRGIINKREKAMKEGEVKYDDLLGMLMESNFKEIQKNGNKKDIGITIEDVIEECKVFYFAGQETTSCLLVWAMVLLGKHSQWQAQAREEIFQVFGNNKPDFDGLNHLKVLTMILHEVLRLYPPATLLIRNISEKTKLGEMNLPPGVQLSLPIMLVHHDNEIWGDDAKEFKPERFSKGVAKATKSQASFFPFGGGPRFCIGQNFAMIEVKMAIAMILQKFSFELSPSYVHAPFPILTLQPRYGAQMILHKI